MNKCVLYLKNIYHQQDIAMWKYMITIPSEWNKFISLKIAVV